MGKRVAAGTAAELEGRRAANVISMRRQGVIGGGRCIRGGRRAQTDRCLRQRRADVLRGCDWWNVVEYSWVGVTHRQYVAPLPAGNASIRGRWISIVKAKNATDTGNNAAPN